MSIARQRETVCSNLRIVFFKLHTCLFKYRNILTVEVY